MNTLESYIFLFCDSFFSALILPPRSEMVAQTMLALRHYNSYLIFILACSASVAGSLTNWWVGRYFLFLRKTDFFQKKQKEIAESEKKWHKFLVWILLFSWLDVIGSPFAVMAGFFKTNLQKFLFLVLAGKFCYYFLLVFCDLDLRTIYG